MKMAAGQFAIDEFDRADLDDAMAVLGFESGRFSVEDDLTVHRHPLRIVQLAIASIARFAAASTNSFSACPL